MEAELVQASNRAVLFLVLNVDLQIGLGEVEGWVGG
jgi:hypothetical protein